MTPPAFLISRTARQDRQGMALILTLAILALMSILLVSFVAMATLDRGATQSYSKSLQADQIALGGLDVIVSQFQSEIADPALSSNLSSGANNLYIPTASTNAMPQRMTTNWPNMATLIGYSGTNLYTAGSGVTNYSSSSSTLNSSFNGRVISTTRWSKPELMTSTANFPTPQWILVTRGGPEAFTSYTSSMANNAPFNSNYVIGRYAYTVYDTSGLLDANVAGYPSGSATNASGKGLMPWADLTQLTNVVTQSDIDAMVNWRNASSAVTNYASYVTTAATNNGFTTVANGDTCFLSRQELIKYAQTQNPDLTNALPYLTTFSRELNGPTWGPSTPAGSTVAYTANQYTIGTVNPRIPNPRVQGIFTRNNGIPAVVGEPLVKYRFPLDKLALLEKFTGTGTGTLTATDQAQILAYFGLTIASDANGPSFRHWVYSDRNTVGSGITGIMTLNQVAQQNREPDFFELLQAGILAGSLGVPGKNAATGAPNPGRSDQYPVNGTAPSPMYQDTDDLATLQALRIGANIIDQWDSDSFPTTVTYSPPGAAGSANAKGCFSVEGIEDLPYPFAAYLNVYAPTTGTTGTPTATFSTGLPPFDFYLYFALWNPHQTPATTTAANYPTGFRFFPFYNSSLPNSSDSFVAGFANSAVISPGSTNSASWFYNGTTTTPNGSANSHTPIYLANVAPSGVAFNYSPATTVTAYREPAIASGTTAGAPWPWNTNACFALPPLTNFPSAGELANQHGVNVKFPTASSGAGGPNSAWQTQVEMTLVMPIQYQDAAGNWHTYATFIGMDDPAGTFTTGTCYDTHYGDLSFPISTAANPNAAPTLSAYSLVKSDPRTSRFGVGANAFQAGTINVNLPLSTSSGAMNNPVNSASPFLTSAASPPVGPNNPYRLDFWAANSSSVPVVNPHAGTATTVYNPYYPDVDGVQRVGDAANSYKTGTPTSPLFTGANANRPVMLNRPFQSVGELGYAFRDMPWKTLDLFSANSADSGLLDLFTLSDAPVIAGRVNPNTPYPQVLAALLAGETQSTSGATTVPAAQALTVAQAITATTSVTPFVTRADLVNNFMTNAALTGTSGLAPTGIKTEEEAVVRAIAEPANTRTWNLLIDIIAQTGRYPSVAIGLDNFMVEGERRYWLHVAIDRYTGQVVGKQLEVVNE